jgi:hypothetical protein
MAFDDELALIDGTVALDPTSDAEIASLTRDAYGKVVLDVRKTGENGLVAVMLLPTAPTTYADTLTAYVQHSNHITDGWSTISAFPVLYAAVREVWCTATTAFVSTDIGLVLTARTDSASDGGVILDFDPALLVVGGYGRILVQMSDANDDYSTAGDTLTATSGTGVGTQGIAGALTKSLSYGIYTCQFRTNKRYIRPSVTVSAGGDFGKVAMYLVDKYPMTAKLG